MRSTRLRQHGFAPLGEPHALAADPVSQGILIAISETFEKHAWMLRVQVG